MNANKIKSPPLLKISVALVIQFIEIFMDKNFPVSNDKIISTPKYYFHRGINARRQPKILEHKFCAILFSSTN